MAQNPPVNLDKAWLENFLNHDVAEFIAEIKKIMGDGTGPDSTVVPALESLLPSGSHGDWTLPGAQLPITIGGMSKDSATNGQHINDAVVEDPSLVNSDPFGTGWLFKVRIDGEAAGLLSADEYAAFCGE